MPLHSILLLSGFELLELELGMGLHGVSTMPTTYLRVPCGLVNWNRRMCLLAPVGGAERGRGPREGKQGSVDRGQRIHPKRAAGMVLYQDGDILAINKPAGMAVHGGPKVRESIVSFLSMWQFGLTTPPHLAHRLDRDTSGVLLLTRNTDAARKIAALFRNHEITKTYWAVTVGVPEKKEGNICIPLGVKDIATGRRGRHHRVVLRDDLTDSIPESQVGQKLPSGVQWASTRYRVLDHRGQLCSLLEVQPVTGFKHQVRVHLADGLMTPILGDYKFAGPQLRSSRQLMRKFKLLEWVKGTVYLHAYQLEIPGYGPGGKSLVVTAPPPDQFRKTARMLKLELPLHHGNTT